MSKLTREDLGFGGTLTITTWAENPFALGRTHRRVTLATIECQENMARRARDVWRENNQPGLQIETVWQAFPKFID